MYGLRMLQVTARHDVLCVGKGWHPQAVHQSSVPTDMVAMEVRAHDEVDLFRSSTRGFEILQEDATGHLIPTLRHDPSAPCLAVADAWFDQNRVMPRPHQKGLDHERQVPE